MCCNKCGKGPGFIGSRAIYAQPSESKRSMTSRLPRRPCGGPSASQLPRARPRPGKPSGSWPVSVSSPCTR